ncbi:MAG: PD-(D/E)XK nuclease family protein [Oscillospiraceae bacterium]|nr:PD-(D/E)XK nuclease family protein [Oscillospiraceae bacterium]
MLNLLLSRDWTVAQDELLRRVAGDVSQKQGGRILIVPELISHDMERRLCVAAGDTASRYAEVLSFTRLARRVSDQMGNGSMECLDKGGRVVAMAAAARQLSSQLKAYAAVETKPEFLSGLIDAVDEFKRCCISSEDLKRASMETDGSLAQKLEELALLMEGYDSLCSRGKRDPRDQMTWLLEQLEEGTFGQEHIFYIDGFPDFTRQNLAIISYLIRTSACVTVSLNCDRPDSSLLAFEKAGQTAMDLIQCARKAGVEVKIETFEPDVSPLVPVRDKLFQGLITPGCAGSVLQTFHADTPWQECMHAAQQIRRLIQDGCRYRDISLVCTDMGVYQGAVDLIFHRFGIPVYRSGTEDILQKSVINTVLSALDGVLSGFDQREMLRYFRSALSPLDPDTCDLVENYAIVWGIRGQKWTENWEFHPDGLGEVWDEKSHGLLNRLNEARLQVMEPLIRLRQGFRDASDLRQQVLVVYRFLEDISLAPKLDALAKELDEQGDNRSSQILNQLWDILISALEQMHDVLGQTWWEPEQFTRLFRLLLSQYDVGTIPPVLDAVQMGPVDAMRCNRQKHLILLGAQEGCLPGYSGSAGVLSDQERVTLRQLGVPLTGGAMEGIQAEFAEIYGVFCGARQDIQVTYSGEQPSFVYRRLALLSGDDRQISAGLGFATADADEAGAYLAKWNGESIAEELGILPQYRRAKERAAFHMGKVKLENIKKLYGTTLNLSASQIDRQAECRMSYFLKYGLKAKERKEITVDPAEFGTYVHAVLENTARCVRDMGGFRKVSLEETLEIAHRYSEEYTADRFSQISSERMTYLFRRNVQELDMVVCELWQELRDSLFEPKAFEVSFGSSDGLAPIVIPNNGMNAILRGFVDRVDTWSRQGMDYYRVVDYKTGKKDFDYCDVFNGVGLQMLLYMFALRSSGEDLLGDHPVPVGVQYFPARAPYLPSDGQLQEQEAEKLRQSQWKRKGLLLSDEEILQAMEPGEKPKRMGYTIRKDGSLSGDLADRDQLKLLEGYVFRVLAGMVEDIVSGNVEPNPYTRGSSHNACTFCPYGSVCHEKTVTGRRNYQQMKADRFWAEVEKEMDGHGR